MGEVRFKRLVEWVKSGLIVLLAACALLTGWQTGHFDDLVYSIPLFGSVAEFMKGGSETPDVKTGIIKEAARPLVIVITNSSGERFGVKYDIAVRNEVYDRTSRIVGEALGSAAEAFQVTQTQWREALSGEGLYYEYAVPVSLSILDGWLGTRLPELIADMQIKRIFVVFSGDRNRIYYEDAESGIFYGADTASTAGSVQELEALSIGSEAVFAYQTGIAASSLSPYMLLLPGNIHPVIAASAGANAEEMLLSVLAALGFDYGTETSTPYNIDGGIRVRVGTQFNIRADMQGRILYRRTEGPYAIAGEEQDLTEGELVEMARVIVSESMEPYIGSAEVFFESVEMISPGVYCVNFSYYTAGGRVFLFDDSHAARITFVHGLVTEAEFIIRNYTFADESAALYMERQAFAAAGGEFMLYYHDTGAELIQPAWVRVAT